MVFYKNQKRLQSYVFPGLAGDFIHQVFTKMSIIVVYERNKSKRYMLRALNSKSHY